MAEFEQATPGEPGARATETDVFVPRVLIVDDRPELRTFMRLVLEERSCETREAGSAAEAREVMSEFHPDIVLLDVVMPGKADGLDLCREIKQEQNGSSPSIVLVSAKRDVMGVDQARDFGADGYLIKPFSPAQLLGVMDSLELHKMSPGKRFAHFWPYG